MDVISNQLGLDWVKIQIKWSNVHPDPEVDQWFFYDGAVEEAAAQVSAQYMAPISVVHQDEIVPINPAENDHSTP